MNSILLSGFVCVFFESQCAFWNVLFSHFFYCSLLFASWHTLLFDNFNEHEKVYAFCMLSALNCTLKPPLPLLLVVLALYTMAPGADEKWLHRPTGKESQPVPNSALELVGSWWWVGATTACQGTGC